MSIEVEQTSAGDRRNSRGITPKQPLPRKVVILGWVSFLADISSEMIYPLVPLFLLNVLGASGFALGVIEGAAQALVSILTAASGIISDKTRRRVPFVRWGYGLPIVGKLLLTFASSWHGVFFGRLVDRFGKGLRGSPRDALIASAASEGEQGRAFGFHRMMDTAGALCGVLIAASLLLIFKDSVPATLYRIAFGVAAFFAVFSLLTTFLVKEAEAPPVKEDSIIPSIWMTLGNLGSNYWRALFVLMVFAFANSSDTFLLLRGSDLGLSPLQVVLAYALYNFTYSIFSYPAGKISDRVGRWKVVVIGWLVYASVYAGFALATTGGAVWILFGVYGLYMALTDGVSKALVVDAVPAETRGTALGILYLGLGLSALSSNLLCGFLWDHAGKQAPFWLGSFAALVAVCLVGIPGILTRSRQKQLNAAL